MQINDFKKCISAIAANGNMLICRIWINKQSFHGRDYFADLKRAVYGKCTSIDVGQIIKKGCEIIVVKVYKVGNHSMPGIRRIVMCCACITPDSR